MEHPEAAAGARIEAAHVAFLVALALRDAAREVRRADNDHVVHDDRRRVEANLAGDQVHRLVVVLLEVDEAVLAEGGDRDRPSSH